MYNRYIPQQDGSHKRNRVDETKATPPPQHRPSPPAEQASPPPPPPHAPPPAGDVGGFLRRLLPKNFDTGDLIVVLLLRLMAGDKPEEKNTALLTLALYLFM